ncbi:MAG: PorV/PorQ family protein [Calditrichia bacterium]
MKTRLIMLMLTLAFTIAPAQNVDYAGTSAANFLKIGVGTRFMAMGEAGITLSDDASAQFWNPGAIAIIPNNSVYLSRVNWLVDTQVSYGSVVLHSGSMGTFGADLNFFSSGEMEETTLVEQDGTGRFFDASDMQIGLTYARSMTDRFSVGLKLKYLQENLSSVSASAFGVDIGAVFTTNFLNNMRIGATLSNFGSKMKFDGRDLSVVYAVPGSPSGKEVPARLETQGWELPLLFRFGASTYVVKNENYSLLSAFDILDSRDHDPRYNVGGELGIYETLFVRSGYKINYDETTYSLGMGLNLNRVMKWNARIDYAFLRFGDLDDVSQFGLELSF